MKKIVIDLMGSDNGPKVLLAGVLQGKKEYPNYRYVLVGNKEEILTALKELDAQEDEFEIVDAQEVFSNHDSPMTIAHEREETSLVKALVKTRDDEEVVAMISAGATGGYLVGSILKLGLFNDIRFPALASPMINIHKRWFALLDCGANLDIQAPTLVKFAKMGSAFIKSAFHYSETPRVGLLNVGKEETKGTNFLKEAHGLLKDSSLNFIGNVEGDHIYLDIADVIVCDGYVGNVLLKGTAALAEICQRIVLMSNPDSEDNKKAANTIHDMFNYNEEGAAVLLGTKKICLKAHGSATSKTMVSSIKFAAMLDEGNFIENIREELNK